MYNKSRLELSEKLYQQSIWNNILPLYRGEKVIPSVIDLDPTSMCNLKCPDCISSSVLNTKTFKKETLFALIKELAGLGTKAIVLIGGGEPLLYPFFKDLLKLIADNGIKTGIVTNGLLLFKYEDIISRYSNWVRISVDAAKEETYNQFRPNKNRKNLFPFILENIRSAARNTECEIGFSFVVLVHYDKVNNIDYSNVDEILAACQIAKELGCRYFELKAMLNQDHFIHDYPLHILMEMKLQVDRCLPLVSDDFEFVISSNLKSLLIGETEIQVKDYETCLISQLRTCITSNGIYVCPYHRGNQKGYIGSLEQMSFTRIWENYTHNLINPAKDCGFHCARHSSNTELIKIIRGVSDHPITEDYDLFI